MARKVSAKDLDLAARFWAQRLDSRNALTARDRVARALAGSAPDPTKWIAEYLSANVRPEEIRCYAALSDLDTGRAKGGQPKKAISQDDIQLVRAIHELRFKAASKGENLSIRAACDRLAEGAAFRKKYGSGQAARDRLRRVQRGQR